MRLVAAQNSMKPSDIPFAPRLLKSVLSLARVPSAGIISRFPSGSNRHRTPEIWDEIETPPSRIHPDCTRNAQKAWCVLRGEGIVFCTPDGMEIVLSLKTAFPPL